jgi:hypothetical protein
MSIQEANFKNPETHQRVKSRRDDMYTPRPGPPAMGQSPTHPRVLAAEHLRTQPVA